jgi:hypothetical protein
MSDMQSAFVLATLGYFTLIVALCWAGSRKKRRRNRLLTRLNSPFFRNVYDAYYRAAKLNWTAK